MNTRSGFRWQRLLPALLLPALLSIAACAAPRVIILQGDAVALEEYTLQGTAREKILMVNITGEISDDPRRGLLADKPSMVQEIVSQLRKAEKDETIEALLLKIDSPGGSVTASDVLYHEIRAFRERTGIEVVAVLMDLAVSGGYYVALPADAIVAHPTSLTGSVGVIFLQPKVTGLMDKIGVQVQVSKSGRNKDMGSPFRPASDEERKIIDQLTAQLGTRFLALVREHRPVDAAGLEAVASARVFLPDEALRLNLVDAVGYLDDAVLQAARLAGIDEDARLVVYRRTEFPDDTVYNNRISAGDRGTMPLVDLNLPGKWRTGFYYLWPAAAESVVGGNP